MPIPKPTDGLRRSTVFKVLILWVLASWIYSPTVGYLNHLMFTLVGAGTIVAVIVVRARRTPANITRVLALCLPAVAFTWVIFWNGANLNKIWVLPVVEGVVAVMWSTSKWFRSLCLLAIVGGMLGLAVSGWHWGTNPSVDDFMVMQRGALALLHGHNPYKMWFPSTTLGLPRLRYEFGPLLLLMSVPAVVVGDVRLIPLLAAVGVLGLGAWRLKGTPYQLPLLLLLGVSPWLLWSVLECWTELVATALVLGWYGLRNTWKPSWLLLTMAIASNPLVLMIVAPIACVYPELRRRAVQAVALGVLCYLPVYLLTGHDFIQAFQIVTRQQTYSTVGIGGVAEYITGVQVPMFAAGLVLVLGCLVAYWRSPKALGERELVVAVVASLTVLALPAEYFAYVLMPMLWAWWWTGTMTLELAADARRLESQRAMGRVASGGLPPVFIENLGLEDGVEGLLGE